MASLLTYAFLAALTLAHLERCAAAILRRAAIDKVRLAGVADRMAWDTQNAGERIETALLPGTPLAIQWRPKVSEGQVDAASLRQPGTN